MKARSALAVAPSLAALPASARTVDVDGDRNADFSTIRTRARVKPLENEKKINSDVDRLFRKWEKTAAR